MIRALIFTAFILETLTACATVTTTPTPYTIPASTLIPPPIQGPAVLGDHVENWEYLGPEAVESMPVASDNVRNVDAALREIRLIRTEDGFELVWIELICSTQPVVVVHSDARIEFWPGASVNPDCEEMGVGHKLTVQWQTDIPFGEWKFIFHPPPPPES